MRMFQTHALTVVDQGINSLNPWKIPGWEGWSMQPGYRYAIALLGKITAMLFSQRTIPTIVNRAYNHPITAAD